MIETEINRLRDNLDKTLQEKILLWEYLITISYGLVTVESNLISIPDNVIGGSTDFTVRDSCLVVTSTISDYSLPTWTVTSRASLPLLYGIYTVITKDHLYPT